MNHSTLDKHQELNRSLSNILTNSIDQTVLDKIRDLDPSAQQQQSTNASTTNMNKPLMYRSLEKPNPLRTNAGLYFRDIINQPEKSIAIAQSMRTNGTR
jgi:hypothetical protein